MTRNLWKYDRETGSLDCMDRRQEELLEEMRDLLRDAEGMAFGIGSEEGDGSTDKDAAQAMSHLENMRCVYENRVDWEAEAELEEMQEDYYAIVEIVQDCKRRRG